jgi:hypothetical protein
VHSAARIHTGFLFVILSSPLVASYRLLTMDTASGQQYCFCSISTHDSPQLATPTNPLPFSIVSPYQPHRTATVAWLPRKLTSNRIRLYHYYGPRLTLLQLSNHTLHIDTDTLKFVCAPNGCSGRHHEVRYR